MYEKRKTHFCAVAGYYVIDQRCASADAGGRRKSQRQKSNVKLFAVCIEEGEKTQIKGETFPEIFKNKGDVEIQQ